MGQVFSYGCYQHQNESPDFFCFSCYKLVCAECALESHSGNGCHCKSLSKCRDAALANLAYRKSGVIRLIEKARNFISKEVGKDQLLLESRERVQSTVHKMQNHIEKFTNHVHQELGRILEESNNVVDCENKRQKAEQIVVSLKAMEKQIETTTKMERITDILLALPIISTNLQRQEDALFSLGKSEEPILMKLDFCQFFLDTCTNLVTSEVGKLHVVPESNVDFEDTQTVISGYRIKYSSKVSAKYATELKPYVTIDSKTNEKSQFTDFVLIGHSVIAVDNANSRVIRYRVQTERQYVDQKKIDDAYGIVKCDSSDDIIVTSPWKQPSIVRLSIYSGLSIIDKVDTVHPYYNICNLPYNQFAVLTHTVPENRNNRKVATKWIHGAISHVDIITAKGNVIYTIPENVLCEPNEFGNPLMKPIKNMCSLPNGNIVASISTRTHNVISCSSMSGTIQWTYDINDSVDGICCYCDNIYIYMQEAKLVRVLSITGDLKACSSLRLSDYNGDGRTLFATSNFLAVAHKSDKIYFFELQ